MTVTVKLDAALEEQLRQRAARTGRSASELIRAALQTYLNQPDDGAHARSPFALGQDLFGRHRGAPSLAQERKRALAEVANARHARRGA